MRSSNRRLWTQVMIASFCLGLLCSCGMSRSAQLKRRAEEYFNAWKFNDYETMHHYLNDWGQEQIPLNTFQDFMTYLDTGRDIYRPNDLEADYMRRMKSGGVLVFKILEVYVQEDKGKVKVFLKTSRDLVGEAIIDPNEWVYDEGQWRIDVNPQSPLYLNIQRWRSNQPGR